MRPIFLTLAFLITSPALAYPAVRNTETGNPVIVDVAKPSPDQVAQRERMKACNKGWPLYKKEHNLKGYDRKKYLKECLSGVIEPPVRFE